jgi:hypothetical protein
MTDLVEKRAFARYLFDVAFAPWNEPALAGGHARQRQGVFVGGGEWVSGKR